VHHLDQRLGVLDRRFRNDAVSQVEDEAAARGAGQDVADAALDAGCRAASPADSQA
jgi:hypothetical protein